MDHLLLFFPTDSPCLCEHIIKTILYKLLQNMFHEWFDVARLTVRTRTMMMMRKMMIQMRPCWRAMTPLQTRRTVLLTSTRYSVHSNNIYAICLAYSWLDKYQTKYLLKKFKSEERTCMQLSSPLHISINAGTTPSGWTGQQFHFVTQLCTFGLKILHLFLADYFVLSTHVQQHTLQTFKKALNLLLDC